MNGSAVGAAAEAATTPVPATGPMNPAPRTAAFAAGAATSGVTVPCATTFAAAFVVTGAATAGAAGVTTLWTCTGATTFGATGRASAFTAARAGRALCSGLGLDPHQPLLSSSVGRPPSRGAASRGSLPHPLLPSVPGPVLSLLPAPRSMPLPSWSGVDVPLPWNVPSGFVLEPDVSVSLPLPCSDDAGAVATAASCFSVPLNDLPCPLSLSA